MIKHRKYLMNCNKNTPLSSSIYRLPLTFSDGAKHPTHSDSSTHPRACEDFDGFCVNCLQI